MLTDAAQPCGGDAHGGWEQASQRAAGPQRLPPTTGPRDDVTPSTLRKAWEAQASWSSRCPLPPNFPFACEKQCCTPALLQRTVFLAGSTPEAIVAALFQQEACFRLVPLVSSLSARSAPLLSWDA